MKKQTIYYETLRNGLIPCEFTGWAKDTWGNLWLAEVKLKSTKAGYERGDTVRVPARVIVVKAGVKGGHQMVQSATLPVRTDDNTLTKSN